MAMPSATMLSQRLPIRSARRSGRGFPYDRLPAWTARRRRRAVLSARSSPSKSARSRSSREGRARRRATSPAASGARHVQPGKAAAHADAGPGHVPAGRRSRRVTDVARGTGEPFCGPCDRSRDGALRQMHAERVGQRLPRPPQRDRPGNAHTDDQGGQPRAVDGRGRHALGKVRAGLRPCEAGRTHRCARCPAASSGGGGGRSRTRPAPRTRRTSRHPARRRMRRRPRDGGPRRGRGPSRRASVLPAWPLCPPGCRPLSCRRDRRRSSAPPPSASPARRSRAACRCWDCRARAGAPAPRCARPGRRSLCGARQSRHRGPRGPPSGRRPAWPIVQDRRSSLAREACLPCLLLSPAASAVLAGKPLGHAAPIARQDHDGCAAGLERT